MDLFLKATDKAALDAALHQNRMITEDGYILFTDDYALNILGSISKIVVNDGNETFVEVSGYHANLRILTDSFTISESLLNMAIDPEPTTPVNVWF